MPNESTPRLAQHSENRHRLRSHASRFCAQNNGARNLVHRLVRNLVVRSLVVQNPGSEKRRRLLATSVSGRQNHSERAAANQLASLLLARSDVTDG